jgi:hypothetical protein
MQIEPCSPKLYKPVLPARMCSATGFCSWQHAPVCIKGGNIHMRCHAMLGSSTIMEMKYISPITVQLPQSALCGSQVCERERERERESTVASCNIHTISMVWLRLVDLTKQFELWNYLHITTFFGYIFVFWTYKQVYSDPSRNWLMLVPDVFTIF